MHFIALFFAVFINSLFDRFDDMTHVREYADDLALGCAERGKESVTLELQRYR